jgi:hypothetical protein
MALIKKIDVDNYFAAKRAMRLGRIGMVSQPAAAGTVPAGKVKRAPRLIGNRGRVSSFQSVPATVISIAADSGVKEDRALPASRHE